MKNPNATEKIVCTESTLDSVDRRGFIRKAAIVTAAVGISGSLLSKKVIPESSASSAACQPVTTPSSNAPGTLAIWSANAQITDCLTSIPHNPFPGSVTLGGISCYPVLNVYNCGGNTGILGESVKVIIESPHSKPLSGVISCRGCGIGVLGVSGGGPGVFGCSVSGSGLRGASTSVSASCSFGVFGSSCSTSGIGVKGLVSASSGSTYGVYGQSCSPSGVGVKGYASSRCCGSGSGVYGQSESHSGVGVKGYAPATCGFTRGVYGQSCSVCGIGVQGIAGTTETAFATGVCGASYATCGRGVRAVAGVPGAVPFVAKGAPGQTANLQIWENSSAVPLSVVNKCGWIGIHICKPQTTLQVNGGMSLGLHTANMSTCYTMKTSNFAILANPSVSGLNVILPAAKNAGMVVFVKNISAISVAVQAAGSDQIEVSGTLSSSYPLSNKYNSVTLIAGGGSPGVWYILSSAT